MLPLKSRNVQEYHDPSGRNPFKEWLNSLDPVAAAQVATALVRMEQGNVSRLKSVGQGVHECRINFGPGYRIYLGVDGDVLLILLGGGTKKRQQKDIQQAYARWQDYKTRRGK